MALKLALDMLLHIIRAFFTIPLFRELQTSICKRLRVSTKWLNEFDRKDWDNIVK